MDLRRLRVGEWVAGLGGVALLASLFAPWYGPDSLSAWEALGAIDVLIALAAASGVGLAVITATQRAPAVPIALGAVVVVVGLVGVVLVLLRLIDLPDAASGREWGVWLALAGALGILAGAVRAIRDEHARGAEEARIEFVPAPRP
jgi:FtsH-binding integral membrane protein